MLLKEAFNRKRVQFLMFPVVIVILLLVWALALKNQSTFYNGISVAEVPVTGLDFDKAKEKVFKNVDEAVGDGKIVLQYDDREWQYDFESISMTFMIEDALKEAYKIGRDGNLISNFYKIIDLNLHGINIQPQVDFDKIKLRKILNEIKKQVDQDEKDASVSYEKGKIIVEKEVLGKVLDIDKNLALLENQFKEQKFINTLFVEEKYPKIVYNDVKEINQVISSFSTVFNPQDQNRTYNISLACEKINGTILFPSQIFSMDKSLGPRTLENGYKEAPVIYMNELIKGPGGGICQVTTTLYDAILKAKLDILERAHHSMPLGYVELGQDATISENNIDMKFQNSSDYPVCISAQVSGNTLNIRLLGKSDENRYIVKLKSEILEEYIPQGEDYAVDETLADDQKIVAREAVKGYKVRVYRETYTSNGELLQKEKISEDIYKPIKAQIKANKNTLEKLKAAGEITNTN